ncbi:MAG: hypothetical protein KF753_15225 [Caldilineaceae bacterium]|nr:hypothetical protein [Caldilineaceae bacterium]
MRSNQPSRGVPRHWKEGTDFPCPDKGICCQVFDLLANLNPQIAIAIDPAHIFDGKGAENIRDLLAQGLQIG